MLLYLLFLCPCEVSEDLDTFLSNSVQIAFIFLFEREELVQVEG